MAQSALPRLSVCCVAFSLFLHSIFTDPNLKDGHPDLLDGGKVFVEISALISLTATTIRVRFRGRGFRYRSCCPWIDEIAIYRNNWEMMRLRRT